LYQGRDIVAGVCYHRKIERHQQRFKPLGRLRRMYPDWMKKCDNQGLFPLTRLVYWAGQSPSRAEFRQVLADHVESLRIELEKALDQTADATGPANTPYNEKPSLVHSGKLIPKDLRQQIEVAQKAYGHATQEEVAHAMGISLKTFRKILTCEGRVHQRTLDKANGYIRNSPQA
jgi:hypothetical protein